MEEPHCNHCVPQFYEGQADVYDATRNGLLRGRNTMLSLSVAHLRLLRESSTKKRLVWVDIGGGTGLSPYTTPRFPRSLIPTRTQHRIDGQIFPYIII